MLNVEKNKKGNAMVVLIIAGLLFVIVFFGMLLVIGSSILDYVVDETYPELTTLGVVGDANLSADIEFVANPINSFVQNLTWLTGVVYILSIAVMFGLAFAFKSTGDRWLMPFFIVFVLSLVVGCMIMSNIYEDFYDDNDDLGNRLKEHALISYMILYSPMIMGLVAFFIGIILFGGEQQFV